MNRVWPVLSKNGASPNKWPCSNRTRTDLLEGMLPRRAQTRSPRGLGSARLALGLAAAAIPAFAKPLPDNCAKFEGSDLGARDVSANVDGATVVLSDWQLKVGDDGEYIGFSYAASGGVVAELMVKAGRDRFEASPNVAGGSWTNPNGDRGSSAKAVSHVVVCVGEPIVID